VCKLRLFEIRFALIAVVNALETLRSNRDSPTVVDLAKDPGDWNHLNYFDNPEKLWFAALASLKRKVGWNELPLFRGLLMRKDL